MHLLLRDMIKEDTLWFIVKEKSEKKQDIIKKAQHPAGIEPSAKHDKLSWLRYSKK